MNNKVLFCFAYAGGTADFYKILVNALPADFNLICFDYPGHGNRHREKLCTCFEEVVEDFYPKIKDYILSNNVKEYGLFGYSMGSITCFEIASKIYKLNEVLMPKHIFLAAHEPMDRMQLDDVKESDLDEYVKKRTIDFGAVPEKLINNKSFWRMYLPLYKADYLMIYRCHLEKIDYKLDVPLTVFYSEIDTPYDKIIKWSQLFSKECNYIKFDGPHFFINQYYEEIASLIKQQMEN